MMKKAIKYSVSVFAVVLIILLSVFNCFAKGTLTLDKDVSAKVGDTVTYTLYLADCEKPIADMVAHIFYDADYLALDKDSVDFHDLIGVNRNVDLDGHIPFNYSTLSAPVDFSEKTPIFSADFKVKKEGTSSIQYFFGEMDSVDTAGSESVRKFTLTCDYTIHSSNGDKTVENATPVVLDDQDKLNEYQGAFVNYADGKGEQDDKGDNHIAVTGVPDEGVIDVTKGASNNNTTIIITVAVIVIFLVIIILVVLKRAFGTKSSDDEETDAEEDENEEDEE